MRDLGFGDTSITQRISGTLASSGQDKTRNNFLMNRPYMKLFFKEPERESLQSSALYNVTSEFPDGGHPGKHTSSYNQEWDELSGGM